MSEVTDAKNAMEVMSGTSQALEQQVTFLGEIEEKIEEIKTSADAIKSETIGIAGHQIAVQTYFKNFSGIMAANQMAHDAEDAIVEAIDPLVEQTKSVEAILETFIEAINAATEVLASSMETATAGASTASDVAGQIADIVA